MVFDLLDTLDESVNGLDTAIDSLQGNKGAVRDFEKEGFIVPPIPSGDGNGLPSSKIPPERLASIRDGGISGKRRLIHWFIPEFGVVRMYVNPNRINYQYSKSIRSERTKGGYLLQYWGETLPKLMISGTTGSSGVEGINVLYEMYRAEQYAFDSIGLSLAAANANSNLADNIMNAVNGSLGNLQPGSSEAIAGGIGAGLLGSVLGATNASITTSRNIPSLASLAFGVEMYYQGWVFRGYFESITITESADDFLWRYEINFVVTQRRGYRTNYMPWHRSATSGPSNNSEVGGVPLSFKGLKR